MTVIDQALAPCLVAGCRGVSGPVPQPLWMNLQDRTRTKL